MIHVKTAEEIELMRESALIVSRTLGMLAGELKPGVTGLQLDALAETFIRDHGAEPGFLGMYDFPNTLNISPNAQVVHGIPNDTPFQDGDIVSVDCGALKNGFYGDHAYTFEVGEVAPETRRLLEVTKESLYVGISELEIAGIALSPEYIYVLGPGDIIPDHARFGVFWMGREALASGFEVLARHGALDVDVPFDDAPAAWRMACRCSGEASTSTPWACPASMRGSIPS